MHPLRVRLGLSGQIQIPDDMPRLPAQDACSTEKSGKGMTAQYLVSLKIATFKTQKEAVDFAMLLVARNPKLSVRVDEEDDK